MNEQIKLPQGAFAPIGQDEGGGEKLTRPSVTYWADVKRRLLKNKVAMTGFCVILIIAAFALLAPLFSPYSYDYQDLTALNLSPSALHPFGTDSLGRDLWTRIWVGARVSLAVGLFGAIIPSLIGIAVGGISGYFGGKVDMIIMRLIDVIVCIPSLIYIILIMLWIGSGPVALVTAFAMTGWMGMARSVRGLVLQLKEREFVLASRALGASHLTLIFSHLVPNTLGIVVVSVTMAVPGAIFHEAYLSFIGLGISPPIPSWGQLASDGVNFFRVYPWQLLIPALLISLTMLSFNLFGDGLRDALDPRLRT